MDLLFEDGNDQSVGHHGERPWVLESFISDVAPRIPPHRVGAAAKPDGNEGPMADT